MHLIAPLASGIAAAANGTAQVCVRGSSTRATLYDDFEASTSNSSGADVVLDSYGAAVIYVNQLVDVVVKDADGNSVRTFTAGGASPNVEVISQSFTGADYVTAATGASKPTTIQSVLDLWLTNAGAIDWKVLFNGASETLVNSLGSIGGVFYNPKSPEFGALGDGLTNDLAAIQACHDAALAAGGGVVLFPPGNYVVANKLVWSTSVSLICVPGSVIFTSSNGSNAITLSVENSAGTDAPTLIYGVRFEASAVNTGTQLSISHASSDAVVVADCYFGGNGNAQGDGLRTTSQDGPVDVVSCKGITRDAAGLTSCVVSSAAIGAGHVRLSRCAFSSATSSRGAAFVDSTNNSVTAVDCTINFSGCTAGTPQGFYVSDAVGALVVSGCTFVNGTGTSCYAIRIFNGGTVMAMGNHFQDGVIRYYRSAGMELLSSVSFVELDPLTRASGSGAAYTIPNGVSTHEVSSTGTVPDFTMPEGYYGGQELRVLVRNASGGNWAAMTFTGATYTTSLTVPSLNNNTTGTLLFVYSDLAAAGTYVWHGVQAA